MLLCSPPQSPPYELPPNHRQSGQHQILNTLRLCSVRYSPQTAAVCLPCWYVSVCLGVLSPAAGPVWGWPPAPLEERGLQDTGPGYGSDPL